MARRIVTSVSRDSKGRIEWLHGDDAEWSPISPREAATAIRLGVHTYEAHSPAGTSRIHSFKGNWVRTDSDPTLGDNLDLLDSASALGGTGRYRMVAQLRADAVETVARALHSSGAISRTFAWIGGGWEVSAILGVPRFVADGTGLRVSRTAWCSARPTDSSSGSAFSAVAIASTRIEVGSVVAHGEARITLTYSAAPGAVVIETPLAADETRAIVAALESFLARPAPGRSRLPLTGPLADAKQVDLELDAAGTARLGASETKFHGPSFTRLAPSWPWTAGLARPTIAALLAEAVRAELGMLPAPWGRASAVDIGGGSELTYLEFGLRQGAVVISGRVRKPGPPAISADFTAWIGLALSSSGDLTTEVLHTSVDVIEWYAEVADFVSGGAITRAADAALRSSLAAMASGAMDGVFDPAFLNRLVAVGTTAESGLTAIPRRLWVEQGAVWVGGDLELTAPPSEARILAVGSLVSLETSNLLGGDIARVTWDVDGAITELDYERTSLRLDIGDSGVARTVTAHIWMDDGTFCADSIIVAPTS